MTTANNSEIVFDTKSGISEEEQQNILAQINGIAEKNRLSLSAGNAGKQQGFTAKKSGGFFPVLVNIAAIAILAGGALLLSSFQGKTDAHVREGTMVYNSYERALIEEIRKETSSRLEAKEREIAVIHSKLASIDAELRQNPDNNEQLNAMQEEYRATLAQLQDERSRILEDARAREASLQAQLENRTRELAVVAQQSAVAIDFARMEMDRLTGEDSQAAAVEAQMGAFFANLNGQLGENRFDDAAATVQSMRVFLNTPAFQALRSVQARKEMYTQSINSLETLIEMLRASPPAAVAAAEPPGDNDDAAALAALQERNAQLERAGDDGSRRIAELEGRVSALDASNNDRGSRIQFLEGENDRLNRTLSTRNTTISQIQDLVQGKNLADMTLRELNDSLAQIQAALNQ